MGAHRQGIRLCLQSDGNLSDNRGKLLGSVAVRHTGVAGIRQNERQSTKLRLGETRGYGGSNDAAANITLWDKRCTVGKDKEGGVGDPIERS